MHETRMPKESKWAVQEGHSEGSKHKDQKAWKVGSGKPTQGTMKVSREDSRTLRKS